ncbi:hypothetical protein TNCV_3862341 [Trichonephila clavipes]|nr:hypothetical protein TNCV_3862341 [Trichonephila clavipes]
MELNSFTKIEAEIETEGFQAPKMSHIQKFKTKAHQAPYLPAVPKLKVYICLPKYSKHKHPFSDTMTFVIKAPSNVGGAKVSSIPRKSARELIDVKREEKRNAMLQNVVGEILAIYLLIREDPTPEDLELQNGSPK